MPTVVDSTVGATGRDYSTFADWETAAPADLVAADELWAGELFFDGDARLLVTGSCLLSGSTNSDTTRCKYLRAGAGDSWQERLSSNPLGGLIDGAGFSLNANASAALGISEAGGVIENILWNAGTHQSGRWSSILSSAPDSVMRGCYFRKAASSSASVALSVVGGQRCIYMQNLHAYMGTSSAEEYFEFGSAATSEENAPNFLANGLVVTSTNSSGDAASARGTAIWMNSSSSARYTRVIGNYFAGVATLFQAAGVGQFTSDSGYNLTTLARGSTAYTDEFPGSWNKYGGDIVGTWSDAGVLLAATTYAALDMRPSITGALAAAGIRITSPTNPYGSFIGQPWTTRGGTGDVDALGNARSTSAPYIGPIEGAAPQSSVLARLIAIRQSISAPFFFNRNFT